MVQETYDVAVVGGGLGGLATAALLARADPRLSVAVLERASELGGRAATQERDGFCFNEGAHALYQGGAAVRVLRRLGVRWTGRQPPVTGLAVLEGQAHGMPATLGSLLGTGLTGWSGKLQGAKLFARLGSIDTAALAAVPWSEWVARVVPDAGMRAALEMFARVSTYANAPTIASAGATLDQLRLAQRPGVEYLDGGWKTLVAGVADVARAAGVELRTRARAAGATREEGGWRVTLEDGAAERSRALVLATGPATARSIVASADLAAWASRAVPAKTACLDVALTSLPDERTTFALGVDRPLYLSVHSRTARVAPDGAALVSTMKYLPAGQPTDPAADRLELEAWLDLLQPGWRERLVTQRFLPAMVASNAIVTAAGGGRSGRPGPRVPDAPGVYAVGDWVADEGMLLDASLASAERAAREIAEQLGVAKVA